MKSQTQIQLDQIIQESSSLLCAMPRLPGMRYALSGLFLARARESLMMWSSSNNGACLDNAMNDVRSSLRLVERSVNLNTMDALLLAALVARYRGDANLCDEAYTVASLCQQSCSIEHLSQLPGKLEAAMAQTGETRASKRALAEVHLTLAQEKLNEAFRTFETKGFDEPIKHFETAFNLDPENTSRKFMSAYFTLAIALQNKGDFTTSFGYLKRALAHQDALAEREPLNQKYNVRFFQTRSATLTNIGQMANEMEFFTKAQDLGYGKPITGVLLAPKHRVVNPCLLNYWRSKVCVLTDPLLIERIRPKAEALEFDTFYFQMPDGRLEWQWRGMVAIQKEWERESRPPLLTLSDSHRKQGEAVLQALGIPDNAWYVTLHVRDQSHGKMGQKTLVKPTSNRDADIDTYRTLIDEITRRGGWVIRMGDQSMKPLPELERVIDYPHTKFRSDWMDIFLVASSRFFTGTVSGLHGVAMNFGVPTLLTNVSPMASFPLYAQDLFIPKRLWSHRENRFLTYRESLTPPFDFFYNVHVLEDHGIELISNTPEELQAALIEMLERVEGRRHYNEKEESLQRHFRKIVESCQSGGISCRIGSAFLAQHPELLELRESSLALQTEVVVSNDTQPFAVPQIEMPTRSLVFGK